MSLMTIYYYTVQDRVYQLLEILIGYDNMIDLHYCVEQLFVSMINNCILYPHIILFLIKNKLSKPVQQFSGICNVYFIFSLRLFISMFSYGFRVEIESNFHKYTRVGMMYPIDKFTC